jgi:hypothetical protein
LAKLVDSTVDIRLSTPVFVPREEPEFERSMVIERVSPAGFPGPALEDASVSTASPFGFELHEIV